MEFQDPQDLRRQVTLQHLVDADMCPLTKSTFVQHPVASPTSASQDLSMPDYSGVLTQLINLPFSCTDMEYGLILQVL